MTTEGGWTRCGPDTRAPHMFRHRSHVSACVFRHRSHTGIGADAAVSPTRSRSQPGSTARAHAIPATDLACGSPLEEGTPACATETDPTPLMHAVRGVFLRSVRSAAGPGGPVVSEAGAFLTPPQKTNTKLIRHSHRPIGRIGRITGRNGRKNPCIEHKKPCIGRKSPCIG